MDKFLRNENGNYMYMWFRDSRDSSRAYAMHGHYYLRSLNSIIVRDTSIAVRPAFVIDLSNVEYTNPNQHFVK